MQNGSDYSAGTDASMQSHKSELLFDTVYRRLRDMILANVLSPGQKLIDRDLAEELGISRTPVREALGRLAMMGLVEARSRRGYYVRQYTVEQVSDIYDFRKILEVNAARLAAKNARPEDIRVFDRILSDLGKLDTKPANLVKYVELDLEIHNQIGKASGNASLYQAIQNLMDKVMCFFWVDWVDASSAHPEEIAIAHREHTELIISIKEHDSDEAARKLAIHIDHARNNMTSLLRAREELRDAVLAGVSSR